MQQISAPSNLAEADAFKATIERAATQGGHIVLEPGNYPCNIDLPNGTKGLVLRGSGRDRTFLRSKVANQPVLRCNGMWFSHFADLSLGTERANEENAVVDIDGSVKGRGHGIQGNTFDNVNFDGRGSNTGGMSNVVFAMCRQAQSSGQGDTNCFINCHFFGAKRSLVYIVGYNALNNQFIGGNCQVYEKNALEMVFGSFHIFGMAFQSTVGIKQLLNDGWDIRAEGGGVGDCLSINACRTESLRFIKSNVAQPPTITNCNQAPGIVPWWPNYGYAVDTGIMESGVLYQCVQAHRSGMDKEEALANVKHWKPVTFNVVETPVAVIFNNTWSCGDVACYHDPTNPVMQVVHQGPVGKPFTVSVPLGIKVVTVDAARGPVRLDLPGPLSIPIGFELEVIRGDTPTMMVQPEQPTKLPEYPVTVNSAYFNNEAAHALPLRTGTGGRSIRLRAIGGGSFPRRWYVV